MTVGQGSIVDAVVIQAGSGTSDEANESFHGGTLSIKGGHSADSSSSRNLEETNSGSLSITSSDGNI